MLCQLDLYVLFDISKFEELFPTVLLGGGKQGFQGSEPVAEDSFEVDKCSSTGPG